MDRNDFVGTFGSAKRVALRKESVDRNIKIFRPRPISVVALRKESVDRNCV